MSKEKKSIVLDYEGDKCDLCEIKKPIHEDGVPRLECDRKSCDFRACGKRHMLNHEHRFHADIRRHIVCPICKREFTIEIVFKKHLLTKHEGVGLYQRVSAPTAPVPIPRATSDDPSDWFPRPTRLAHLSINTDSHKKTYHPFGNNNNNNN